MVSRVKHNSVSIAVLLAFLLYLINSICIMVWIVNEKVFHTFLALKQTKAVDRNQAR